MPAGLGGIALTNPTQGTEAELLASRNITQPLTNAILQQNPLYTEEMVQSQLEAKKEVKKKQKADQASDTLKQALPLPLKKCVDLAQEKGASSLPIDKFGFALHKGAFQDALALRYNWQPTHSPSTCDCGSNRSRPKGGFPSISKIRLIF